MRGLTVAVAAAAMLVSGGAGAFPVQVPVEPLGEPAEMTQLRVRLEQAEAELSVALTRLQAYEDEAAYEEAERLGVAAQVRASGLPEHQQRRLAVAIVREAQNNGVDPMLVIAVIRCESSFNNYAVSHVGAMGLMQVMPDTGTWLADKAGFRLGRKTNLFDAETNVALGTAYLAELIERFGTVEKALVAYNAGPTQAQKILSKKESRTRFMAGYPTKVVKEFRKLKAQQVRELTTLEAPKTAGREG
ncbi:transglycosylase SLT domain-containing protein [Myxococcus stipitatus DSM 14675]|uniref:Transglycosylase SLT domain-containing protein n=1 Tax=Myxococcus stipitatus (strain DSM 14675 / JCM 12634 / Mx s8) TaxID=1278073 RepID=L7UCU4_MYXSD|nr:lytic transglycosylase domain-containing protein [Myxococcus stipitatus]AGC45863.1 transglycosylase SLT domain-containing protein [Myxococcus stipitatus DSM 14675]